MSDQREKLVSSDVDDATFERNLKQINEMPTGSVEEATEYLISLGREPHDALASASLIVNGPPAWPLIL